METIAARYDQALCFAEVAEQQSFTRAAARLGCSKAHVSKQVSALEQALGAQLLLRTTRRLTLTEAGTTYLEYCKQMRVTLREAEHAVTVTRAEVRGTLRITAATGFGSAFLLDLMLAFQERYPAIELAIDLSLQRRDLAADGFDFAIRSTRELDDHLVARSLGLLAEVPVASPQFLARHPRLVAPSDLARVPCLLNSHFRDDDEWVFERDGTVETVRVTSQFRANHYGLLRDAAVRGAGVVRLPRYVVADALADGTLVRVLPHHGVAPMPLYLVYVQRQPLPYKHRAFRDFAVAWFNDPARASQLRD